MTPAYYAIQEYLGSFDSQLDRKWRTKDRYDSEKAARRDFRELWLAAPYVSTRVVRAFVSEFTGDERVLEILDLREAKES